MQTRLTRKPGQKGTKKLKAIYGDKLICVRYRYDMEKRKRYKTVELIVEEVDWLPHNALVLVRVAWGEKEMGIKVKNAGGKWNTARKAWELTYDKVVELGLENRVVRGWEE